MTRSTAPSQTVLRIAHRKASSQRQPRILLDCKRGEEDLMAHERKDIAGDWQNYFTQRDNDASGTRYGHLLTVAGYSLTTSGNANA